MTVTVLTAEQAADRRSQACDDYLAAVADRIVAADLRADAGNRQADTARADLHAAIGAAGRWWGIPLDPKAHA